MPKNDPVWPKIGIFVHCWLIWCPVGRLAGSCGAGCISQDTYLLYPNHIVTKISPIVIRHSTQQPNLSHHLGSTLSTAHQVQGPFLQIFSQGGRLYVFGKVFLQGPTRSHVEPWCNLLNSTYSFQVTSLPDFLNNFRRLSISDQTSQSTHRQTV